MGMSLSQPQPVTQGTMGSPTKNYGPAAWHGGDPTWDAGIQGYKNFRYGEQPQPAPPTKNYGPVGGMVNSAQNQVNPQSSPTGAMNNLMGSLPGQNTAPQPPMGNPGFMPMGNAGFMPMGNAGFMPMGNHNFMPTGFGQMPQQPQMPTFGGPRGGKAPQ